ncbi:DUF2970 domain-containing protein [Duganella sp. BuS-21]|uniref:DUF2970 domain-containing protein n=1 Tax=Duganella sp. BuS-21 TaxID=2943848 RepID=UPI0035A5CDF4
MNKKRGFLYTVKAVLWSFVGLRRKRDFDEDQEGLNPFHIIIAAVLAVAVLIAILISIVKLVVAQ